MDNSIEDPMNLIAPIAAAGLDSGSLLPEVLPTIELDEIYDLPESDKSDCEDSDLRPSATLIVQIPECGLISPRSCYEPFEPPCQAMPEHRALHALLPERNEDDDFLELKLDDFAVYCSTGPYREEMRSLHQLDTEPGSPRLCFDGVLSNGTERVYVHGVDIYALPIGNYGQESRDQTRDNIWLQSERNAKRDVYYKLGTPAAEYKRFYEPFLWIADLAKHVVDYLAAMHAGGQPVIIHHFQQDFSDWLLALYTISGNIEHVQNWMSKYPRLDYRSAVNTNISFLRKESIGVLGEEKTDFHPLWDEVLFFQKYPLHQPQTKKRHTVVTKYIFDCFCHLPFGKKLEAVDFGAVTERLRSKLIAQRSSRVLTTPTSRQRISQQSDIEPGDTISTTRDAVESGTVWEKEDARNDQHVDLWFALVQSVSVDSDGHQVFEVIWYYRPVDTLCGLMKYPWTNELFLSDHCSCQEDVKIRDDEVLGVHQVDFGGTPDTSKEFFCRQVYMAEERTWISLEQSHLKCNHSGKDAKYDPGDTVLVQLAGDSNICEPCEVITTAEEFGTTRYVLGRLLRRRFVDASASSSPPNELVYTKDTIKFGPTHIVGKCHVRWFSADEPIPTPYDRDGVGAFFYLTHQKTWTKNGFIISPLERAPSSLKQGYDPREESVPKLRGLDLFCGGGNFGRGLEEGGSVAMRWANDMDEKALHTYMANTANSALVSPFLGSIDDLQRLAIQGQFADNVPKVGEVDFISGGSPCPGFSLLTNDRTAVPQRKNQSLVAAFASCVDLYRPKYGILENVVGIIQKNNRYQDVFSQLMCALVGMGYQARLFFLDALSCGSAQMRPRVFIIFAAPGWVLPDTPLQTHSYQRSIRNLRLGRLPNGEPMAQREIASCAPFPFKSAAQATVGLPAIYDAKVDICIPFPDHRVVSHTNTTTTRKRVRLIPKFPFGMNFSQAWYGQYGSGIRAAGQGVLSRSERDMFPQGQGRQEGANSTAMGLTTLTSNAYGRQQPNLPMATVVTCAGPGDAKQGRTIHWEESRCLTVMEAKRAQGIRDEEILLGSATTQYKIVGNSVAREVSLALGAVITDAVVRSYGRDAAERVIIETEVVDEDMVERSPFWEDPASRAELETPETSVPTSPGVMVPGREEYGGAKRQRLG